MRVRVRLEGKVKVKFRGLQVRLGVIFVPFILLLFICLLIIFT